MNLTNVIKAPVGLLVPEDTVYVGILDEQEEALARTQPDVLLKSVGIEVPDDADVTVVTQYTRRLPGTAVPERAHCRFILRVTIERGPDGKPHLTFTLSISCTI